MCKHSLVCVDRRRWDQRLLSSDEPSYYTGKLWLVSPRLDFRMGMAYYTWIECSVCLFWMPTFFVGAWHVLAGQPQGKPWVLGCEWVYLVEVLYAPLQMCARGTMRLVSVRLASMDFTSYLLAVANYSCVHNHMLNPVSPFGEWSSLGCSWEPWHIPITTPGPLLKSYSWQVLVLYTWTEMSLSYQYKLHFLFPFIFHITKYSEDSLCWDP